MSGVLAAKRLQTRAARWLVVGRQPARYRQYIHYSLDSFVVYHSPAPSTCVFILQTGLRGAVHSCTVHDVSLVDVKSSGCSVVNLVGWLGSSAQEGLWDGSVHWLSRLLRFKVSGAIEVLRKVAINDVLPGKAARRDTSANLESFEAWEHQDFGGSRPM